VDWASGLEGAAHKRGDKHNNWFRQHLGFLRPAGTVLVSCSLLKRFSRKGCSGRRTAEALLTKE